MREWLNIARQPRIMKRALRYALVVGAVLITINYGDMILKGQITPDRLFKMALTVIAPYCVSTASSVGAIREMNKQSG